MNRDRNAMTHILILSGGGQFTDPWHPFAETSDALAQLLRQAGHTVDIRNDVEHAATELSAVDVLVANAADGPVGAERTAAHDALRRYLADGGPVFALHVGASTLLGLPEWEGITGMSWVDGQSMHPPLGDSRMLVDPSADPIAAGLGDFDIVDERYSKLRTDGAYRAFVTHVLDGTTYPVMWARQSGPSRVVVDTMGHDRRSFDSPEHRQLIERSFEWLAGG